MSSNNIKFNNCKVCGKKMSKSFYDKSIYRPLCSRRCYSKYIDSLPLRYKGVRVEVEEPNNEYYMRGRLHLVNYNLNI